MTTDEMDKLAELLIFKFRIQSEDPGKSWLVPQFAQALRDVRNETLEEAARLAEEEDYYADGEKFTRDQVRHNIACSILGLKK